jgi:hypothetical protein
MGTKRISHKSMIEKLRVLKVYLSTHLKEKLLRNVSSKA